MPKHNDENKTEIVDFSGTWKANERCCDIFAELEKTLHKHVAENDATGFFSICQLRMKQLSHPEKPRKEERRL